MDPVLQQHGASTKLPRSRVAEGPLVLLAEPDAVVALDLFDALQTAGYRVAGPMHSGAEAIRWLEHAAPDCAVIDIQLADGFALELGHALHGLGTPFRVHSANPFGESIATGFWGIPWLSKPCWSNELVAALTMLLTDRETERAAALPFTLTSP